MKLFRQEQPSSFWVFVGMVIMFSIFFFVMNHDYEELLWKQPTRLQIKMGLHDQYSRKVLAELETKEVKKQIYDYEVSRRKAEKERQENAINR